MVKRLLKGIGGILMPFDISCSLCKSEHGMGSGLGICSACCEALPAAAHVEDVAGLECFCAFEYSDDIRRMITSLKYHGARHYARTLGILVADCLIAHEWMAGCIVPVPLHKKRLGFRGFNQSELIAGVVSEITGMPVVNDLVTRHKQTKPQPGLMREERMKNVSDAFSLTGIVDNNSILLLDDVLTTGSTLGECRKVLESGGANCKAVAVARAFGDDGEPDN